MNVAVRRTSAPRRRRGPRATLNVAFRAGSVTGMLVVGLGLFGVSGYYAVLTELVQLLAEHCDP